MVKLQSQNFSYAVRFKLLLCDISLKNTFSERCMFWSAWECRPVVLNRVCAPAQRGLNKFPWGCEPFRTLQMESLVIKFPNKYTWFYSIFKVRGRQTRKISQGRRGRKRVNIHCCSLMFTECICEWTICAVKMVRESTTKSCCVV